ncbi:uncharacterized protein LAESUDRAFT_761671 [Laetiporus sulphureus 93-53]|uniref:Uncharacterized protein n=1 Tax=Laetiporus sulphureus 93-53 TaxID=1314785 RepID=A0A165CZN0_9APHY|nr:uncharacterized protein LAESUDRAFT_761671 [Laetiporus sulphureus 93-53]KZT03831.1 hypothetical protein LAESUDRAFT_761671 [Laetiporus sulphureus 93-53]
MDVDGFVKPIAQAETVSSDKGVDEQAEGERSKPKKSKRRERAEMALAVHKPLKRRLLYHARTPTSRPSCPTLASKGLAAKLAKAISQILGIAPSSTLNAPSLITSASSTPFIALETLASKSATASAEFKLQDLTTSSKSVMDYLREKLSAKNNRASVFMKRRLLHDYDDRPRGGLGLRDRGSNTRPARTMTVALIASTVPSLNSGVNGSGAVWRG